MMEALGYEVKTVEIKSNWRDIDKHPLPSEPCKIDLKLCCGSILIDCIFQDQDRIYFRGHMIFQQSITQWRDAK